MSSSASRRSNLACWPLVDPSSISASNWRMRSRWNPGISSARPANAYWPTDGAVGCRTWRNRTTQLASTSRRASHGRLVDMPAHRHDGRRIANRRRRHPFEAHRRNTTVGTGWWLFTAKVPGRAPDGRVHPTHGPQKRQGCSRHGPQRRGHAEDPEDEHASLSPLQRGRSSPAIQGYLRRQFRITFFCESRLACPTWLMRRPTGISARSANGSAAVPQTRQQHLTVRKPEDGQALWMGVAPSHRW